MENYAALNGEIVFAITDDKKIEVNFESEIEPNKIIKKGDVMALRREAPKHRWIYKIKYDSETAYYESLDKMVNQLCKNKEYVNQLVKTYEDVSITIYIRSDFGQIGYSLPNHVLKKLSLLDCALYFDIISFGMVIDE